jgi:hypothetical protein
LPCAKQFHRIDLGVGPDKILGRVQTDLRGDHAEQPRCVYRDPLALQLADATDALLGEQLVAADMNAGNGDKGCAGIDLLKEPGGLGRAEIGVAAPDRLHEDVNRVRHITDIGKALGAQQLFAYVLGSKADRRGLRDPHGRSLELTFGG